jgi:hypothetical protein
VGFGDERVALVLNISLELNFFSQMQAHISHLKGQAAFGYCFPFACQRHAGHVGQDTFLQKHL